jgi:hypothetical protein
LLRNALYDFGDEEPDDAADAPSCVGEFMDDLHDPVVSSIIAVGSGVGFEDPLVERAAFQPPRS